MLEPSAQSESSPSAPLQRSRSGESGLHSAFRVPRSEIAKRRTLILALGNPILSDDAVGWAVADRLAACIGKEEADIIKESGATFDLVGKLAGYDRIAIIDAIQLGTKPVGSVHRFTLDDFRSTVRHSSAHDVNFATAFQMARELGCKIPDDIRIYAVEVKELNRFSETCTPEIAGKLDEIAGYILADLRSNR